MKKILTGLSGLALLLIAVVAFANSAGTPGDKTGQISAEKQKFLQETKELRKESHDLRCELLAASQAANPDQQKIAGLKKEISGLRQEIQAKANELGVTLGAGNNQHKPLNCSGVTQ